MKTLRRLTTGLLLAAMALTGNITFAASSGERLQQGLYAEEVEGNIDAAIKDYGEVIKDSSAPPNQVAQALYRQGMCYMKIKDEAAARAVLEKLVANYPDQREIIEKARPILNELTDFDPAALMPAGTLVYAEFGTPGRQIETILNTLKGTPFENPLAAVGNQPGQQANGQKNAGDIVGALLNPSMLAEFKKIRSSAVGVTGIAQNHPPMVAVLYPGKSDALRGLIQAGLGMAGKPGEALEGMQTVNLPEDMAVAYDDNVVIMARPASQLLWCVNQYKGLTSEPSLASSNKSFEKISKTQRQKNLITVWAKVDDAYGQLLKMFPPGQVPPGVVSANALIDFSNIDELVLTKSVETNGIASRLEFEFKDGHHCLAYDLIRTPNISKAALGGVPAEAVAVASISLSETDGAQTDKLRAKVQNLTGLDMGREIFANIEQITLFAMPAADDAGTNVFLPGQLGLAITSRNPDQTRQLLETILGTVAGGQPAAAPGQYKISKAGQPELYCYMEQVDGMTFLSLNRSIVSAATAALKNHQSICVAGPLSSAVNKLPPAASKLTLVNAGGAIRLFGPQMKFGPLSAEQAAQLKSSFDQLARATAGTTIELRTDEQLNEFAIDSGLTGLPRLSEVIGPITQISRIANEANAAAAARNLQMQIPATIMPATTAPAIDGNLDAAWDNARAYKLENVIFTPSTSPADLSASYRAMWDETNLYVFVDVTDDVLLHDTPADDWYDSDSVEIYIDAENAKASTYGQNDYQYTFSWDKTSPSMQEIKHNRTSGVEQAMVTTDKGYRLEAKFPWTTLGVKPSAGARIGLDVHVNDSDGNGKRDSIISWHDRQDNAWQNPQSFGNAELAGLIGWWKLDETQGTVAQDSSGLHHDGKLEGNAKWAHGKRGGAIDLDGKNSFVRIADKSAFDLGNEVTVAAWVNIRSVPVDYMAFVTKGDTAWRLSTFRKDSRFHFAVNDYQKFAENMCVNAAEPVPVNEWHYVTGVYNGNQISLYVDGKLSESKSWDGNIGRNNFDVLIGENAETKNHFCDGLIHDVRIYNYALSEGEIKDLAAGHANGDD
jgi:hypothetical protein